MLKPLQKAIDRVQALSPERQAYAARVLTEIADADAEAIPLSEAERDALLEGLAELDRGEIATPAEVRAVYDKYRG